MSRQDPAVRIRLPQDIKEWVTQEARRSMRSVTAQIAVILRDRMEAQAASAASQND